MVVAVAEVPFSVDVFEEDGLEVVGDGDIGLVFGFGDLDFGPVDFFCHRR